MSQYQFMGIRIYPTPSSRPSCERCSRKIKNQYLLLGEGEILLLGVECAQNVLNNPKLEKQVLDIETIVKRMALDREDKGACFQAELEGSQIALYTRKIIKGRAVRPKQYITQDQLTALGSLLGFKVELIKTYFFNQIFRLYL